MAKESRYMVRFDSMVAKRIENRAQERGMSVAEYIRTTVERDLHEGGSADALAPVNAKVSLVTGIMLRQVVDHIFGAEAGKRIEAAAQESADAMIAAKRS